MTTRPRALLAALTAIGVALTTSALTATATSAATSPPPSTTSAVEAKRVDRVTAKPDWFDCSTAIGVKRASCGTIKLPLDYDNPKGATTEVALLRIRVADKSKKIGTLFVNPGGPGGSGVVFAADAARYFSPALLARFDVVGFDPRGINFSDNVTCFKNFASQANALQGLSVPFPVGSTQRAAYISSSERFGRACSTTGKPLSASMSTAEVARDMDVLRRAVGDKKLTYLGFSYGTYLGDVYANLFPDRVRALVIDGVLDPVAWAGTSSTASIPQTQRLRSGDGAAKALNEILVRCRKAGKTKCQFAALGGDPVLRFDRLMKTIKKTPIVIKDDESGEVYFTIDYATAYSLLLSDLYSPSAGDIIDSDLSFFAELTVPGTSSAKKDANAGLRAHLQAKAATLRAAQKRTAKLTKTFGFPYDNSPEAFQSVLCTDGSNPAKASSWTSATKYADLAAPGFGPLWAWASAPCASSTWTARDEDSYRGGFTARTQAPVLVVGNYWDPATNYAGAVKAASLLKNARLLSSDSWGHTAYGTSACVTGAVDAYLTSVTLPAVGKVCKGDDQPFVRSSLTDSGRNQGLGAPKRALPPVVPPIPGAVPRY